MRFTNDPNFNYLADVAQRVKTANMVNGTGVVPLSFNHPGSMVDPDPMMAINSQVAGMRLQNTFMNLLADAPMVGTGLRKYVDVLNLNDQTVAFAVNHPSYAEAMAPVPGKAASIGGIDWNYEPTEDEHYDLLANSGLFQEYVPSKEDWAAIQSVVNEKTASDTIAFLQNALQNGYFHSLGLNDTIPVIFGY